MQVSDNKQTTVMSHPTKSPPKKLFKFLSDQELALKRRQMENQHTLNAERNADAAFKEFLKESGCETIEYHLLEELELSKWLSKFWFAARMKPKSEEYDGELYSVSTLRSFRYVINRILKKKGHDYDITKSPNFKTCMDAFNDAVKEMKENGKGHVNSADEIMEEGI